MVESDLMTQDRISNQTRKRGPTTAPLSLFLAGNTSPGSQHGVLSEKRIRLKAKRAREILEGAVKTQSREGLSFSRSEDSGELKAERARVVPELPPFRNKLSCAFIFGPCLTVQRPGRSPSPVHSSVG